VNTTIAVATFGYVDGSQARFPPAGVSPAADFEAVAVLAVVVWLIAKRLKA